MASLGEPATETVFEAQLTPLLYARIIFGGSRPWWADKALISW